MQNHSMGRALGAAMLVVLVATCWPWSLLGDCLRYVYVSIITATCVAVAVWDRASSGPFTKHWLLSFATDGEMWTTGVNVQILQRAYDVLQREKVVEQLLRLVRISTKGFAGESLADYIPTEDNNQTPDETEQQDEQERTDFEHEQRLARMSTENLGREVLRITLGDVEAVDIPLKVNKLIFDETDEHQSGEGDGDSTHSSTPRRTDCCQSLTPRDTDSSQSRRTDRSQSSTPRHTDSSESWTDSLDSSLLLSVLMDANTNTLWQSAEAQKAKHLEARQTADTSWMLMNSDVAHDSHDSKVLGFMSEGTRHHATGECKPCLYVHSQCGCWRRSMCRFCHDPSHGMKGRASAVQEFAKLTSYDISHEKLVVERDPS